MVVRHAIGLVGYARSGKDTVATLMQEHAEFQRFALADGVRDAAYELNPLVADEYEVQYLQDLVDELGWELAKGYPDVRKTLQSVGQLFKSQVDEHFWITRVARKMRETRAKNVLITDIRFPEEVILVDSVVRIVRPGVGPVNDHVSETGINSIPHDFILYNEGSLEDQRENVADLVELMRENGAFPE